MSSPAVGGESKYSDGNGLRKIWRYATPSGQFERLRVNWIFRIRPDGSYWNNSTIKPVIKGCTIYCSYAHHHGCYNRRFVMTKSIIWKACLMCRGMLRITCWASLLRASHLAGLGRLETWNNVDWIDYAWGNTFMLQQHCSARVLLLLLPLILPVLLHIRIWTFTKSVNFPLSLFFLHCLPLHSSLLHVSLNTARTFFLLLLQKM